MFSKVAAYSQVVSSCDFQHTHERIKGEHDNHLKSESHDDKIYIFGWQYKIGYWRIKRK